MSVLSNHTPCWVEGKHGLFDTNGGPTEVPSLQPLPAVFRCWKLWCCKDVCMFRMVGANQTGPTLMKLTTICDVSHMISYTRAFLSLIFFFWGHREEGLGMRLICCSMYILYSLAFINPQGRCTARYGLVCPHLMSEWVEFCVLSLSPSLFLGTPRGIFKQSLLGTAPTL